jgi:uncharacterized protein YlaI
MMSRVCIKCGVEKSLTEFHRNSKSKDGHLSQCKSCKALYSRSHAPAYRKRAAHIARVWRAANPGKIKASKLRRLYELSLADFDAMLAGQNGKCAICDKVMWAPYVDHNHALKGRGSVRALLCSACNLRLAIVEDKEFLNAALAYLKKHKNKQ